MLISGGFCNLHRNFSVVHSSLEELGVGTNCVYRYIACRVTAAGPSYIGDAVQDTLGFTGDGFRLAVQGLFHIDGLVAERLVIDGFQTGFLLSFNFTLSQKPKFSFKAC